MSDDFLSAGERALRRERGRRPSGALAIPMKAPGLLLGVALQFGPGFFAGYVRWGYWTAVGWGVAVEENTDMLELASALGFSSGAPRSGVVVVTLPLQPETVGARQDRS